jgi:deoxyribose-phosphate aldolase
MGIEATAQAQFLDARADRRWLSEVASSDAALRQVLHGLPGVDQVGTEARAAGLATRSVKREAKLQALDMAVRMVDLTTLEGADTPGKVRAMCAKALRPDPADPAVPPVAAVCIYPDLVGVARAALSGGTGAGSTGAGSTGAGSTGAGSTVAVASVATAFPSGRASLAVKLADVRDATAAGADEVDMVIDRGAFLAGRYGQVYEEVRQVREACGPAHLKVILETAELATLDNVSRASWLAMLAGADFIKTSTGKVSPAATPPVALVMLAAARDYAQATGRRVGVKVAGGVRTAKDAIRYLVLVRETAGPEWLTPALFRIGASSLLNDLLMQRSKQLTGRYAGPDYFTVD